MNREIKKTRYILQEINSLFASKKRVNGRFPDTVVFGKEEAQLLESLENSGNIFKNGREFVEHILLANSSIAIWTDFDRILDAAYIQDGKVVLNLINKE